MRRGRRRDYGIARTCPVCGRDFFASASNVRRGQGKRCSLACARVATRKPRLKVHDAGYVLVRPSDRAQCSDNTPMYEHRVVAEEMIGRPLRSGEVVHHRDGNPRNNDPSNLEVLSAREHSRRHVIERLVRCGANPGISKPCGRCRLVKLLADFSPSSSRGKPTIANRCKACAVLEQRERRIRRSGLK